MLIYVRTDTDTGSATFRTPSREAIQAVKAVPFGCRRWNPVLREWTVTATFWPQVHQALVDLGYAINLHGDVANPKSVALSDDPR